MHKIVVKGEIDLLADAFNEKIKLRKDKKIKFRSCISKINSTLIDNGEDPDIDMPMEDLDIGMLMYNLLEYIQNYSMTLGNLWNYYRDENDGVDDNASDGKSFNY